MPVFSVVIPTFNRSQCIARALESVLQQEEEDWELIIGDDASTDDTLEIAKRMVPSVKIARLPTNRGAAAARNAAFALATGDFIACLDSDDAWLPSKLAKQRQFLLDHSEVAVCASGHCLHLANGQRRECLGKNLAEWPRALQFSQSFHGASTPVIRRSAWQKVGGQDEALRVLEDWDWMLRLSQQVPLTVLEEPLAKIYENRPSNPDYTLLATERFLAKHATAIAQYGKEHSLAVQSQHWENAARTLFRHRRFGLGCRILFRSLCIAPLRNPFSAAAFPLALFDSCIGTSFLPLLLAKRAGLSLV